MWRVSVYWLTHSATHCWLALLSHALCHRLHSISLCGCIEREEMMSQVGLASSSGNSDCWDWMLGFLPSSLSCSALWELSGSRWRPRGQLRETPAWPELCAQMVWKCVWVFFLAKRSVCESRCYSDCTKASEYLITQRERWRKERILGVGEVL